VNVELRLNAERGAVLSEQLATTLKRLDRLAAMRATYANQVAEVKNRAAILERSEQNLAEARAAEASAKASSLLSRIDSPDGGIRPLGPSRIVIVLAGVLGGLLVGFGCVFLCVPLTTASQLSPTAANGHAAPAESDEHWSTPPAVPARFADRPAAAGRRSVSRLTLKQALQKLGDGRPTRRAR
jgi:hypothetical protein